MGNIALLIIAIAFAVLVVFLVIVLHKVSKVVEEANRTVKLVSSDVDVLLHQADGIMTKANTLLDDVNGKVATIDPLFTKGVIKESLTLLVKMIPVVTDRLFYDIIKSNIREIRAKNGRLHRTKFK